MHVGFSGCTLGFPGCMSLKSKFKELFLGLRWQYRPFYSSFLWLSYLIPYGGRFLVRFRPDELEFLFGEGGVFTMTDYQYIRSPQDSSFKFFRPLY